MSHRKVILLADRQNSDVAAIADRLIEGLADVAQIVAEVAAIDDPIEDCGDVDLAIAIGGDGTLISQAVRLLPHGIPLVGVNSGRLGFLAEFDADSLLEHRQAVLGGAPLTIDVLLLAVDAGAGRTFTAMNEALVTAGDPFRILELALGIDGVEAPVLRGDGVIVASPIGSTAHSVSAGGPIVDPAADAIVVTPVAAHSLAARPIVLDGSTTLELHVRSSNEGTALVVDGRRRCTLAEGDVVRITREARTLSLVLNPTTTWWKILTDKLHWAAPPGETNGS